MQLRTWQAIGFVVVVSIGVVFAAVPSNTWLTAGAISLAAGVAALSMMGTAALLSTRFSWIESAFGGLDRMYLTHKWLAVWALVLASFHLVFGADHHDWHTASILEMSRPATRFLRQLSFVALMTIVILALNRKIPYNVWRWWHKLSGPLFLIIVLHWLSIRSPIALASPAGMWLALIASLGLGGAAYKLLLYRFFASHGLYRVVNAEKASSGLRLELTPVRRPVNFKAGQFGFIAMREDGLREPHPFTIASGESGENVHFVIRDLGDYTHRLIESTRVGMYAELYAPHGRFQRPQTAKREAWIAGGVGISPFIAWLTDPAARDFEGVVLFYFFTPGRELPRAEVLNDLAQKRGAQFVAISDGPTSAIFKERFAAIAGGTPADLSVSFCGPRGLMGCVRDAMRTNGVPESNLRFEYFDFR
jgi:predicted ferric reductase